MKRIIINIIAFIIGFILMSIVGTIIIHSNKSNKSPEETALCAAITEWGESNQIDILSMYDFQVYKTITLKDEVEDNLSLHNYRLGWAKSFHKEFLSESNNYNWSKSDRDWYTNRSKEYGDSISTENKIIECLENIKELYPDEYEKVTFTTYKLTYAYTDKDNLNKLELCLGTFDNEGNLVKFLPASTMEWEILGKTSSISNYISNIYII